MKRPILAKLLLCAGLLLATACTSSFVPSNSKSGTPPQLFAIEPTPGRHVLQRTGNDYVKRLLANPANEQITLIKLSPALISGQTQDLAVSLPDGKAAQFHLRDFTSITASIDGWVGYKASVWKQTHAPSSITEIDNDPFYYLSLAREGETLVGSLIVEGQRYQIDNIGAGQHVLIKIDESKLPKEGDSVQALPASAVDDTVGKVPQSGHSTIRVMFLATNQRKAATPNYKLALANALNDANQYLKNSKIDVTYELAGYYEGPYDETGRSYRQQLDDIRLAQPFAGEVLARREMLGADLVSMYSTAAQYCGMAWINATKAQGHSVVSCAGSLAHELGHNLGVNHGWKAGDSVPNPPYMHGYRREALPAFHTQMVTSHGAIPYFSNPRLTYHGAALGTVANHDAARRVNERREQVEHFYPRVLEFTLYEHANFQGRSCVVTLVGTSTSALRDQCGSGWDSIVSSVRIRGFVPGTYVLFSTPGNRGTRSFSSTAYRGNLDVPYLDILGALPAGLTSARNGEAINDRLERISSFELVGLYPPVGNLMARPTYAFCGVGP